MLNFLCSEDPKQQNPLFLNTFPQRTQDPPPKPVFCAPTIANTSKMHNFPMQRGPNAAKSTVVEYLPMENSDFGQTHPPKPVFCAPTIANRCKMLNFLCSEDPKQQNPLFLNIFPQRTQALGRPTPQTSILCSNYRKYIKDAQFSDAARTQISKIHCC